MPERFLDLPTTPLDQIMRANAEWPAFQREHHGAINTTIGVLLDPGTDKPWRPSAVVSAYREVLQETQTANDYGYQQQTGNALFLDQAGNHLAFGSDIYPWNKEHTLAYQTAGGTGALSLAKDTLQALLRPEKDGSIPVVLDSGWPNHPAIFASPFAIATYDRLDPQTNEYNHQGFLDAIAAAPDRPVLLLQTSGYNDDGADRSTAQWDEIVDAAILKEAVIILDSAYLGLANKLGADRYPIRKFLDEKLLTFVCVSTSKNMGLYNERLGALFVSNARFHMNDAEIQNLNQVMARIIRRTVSSQPLLVAKAAGLALGETEYYDELEQARQRLMANRQVFGALLAEDRPAIANGKGLFTKLLREGFTDAQQQLLRSAGILALPNSRVNLGGMRAEQVERVGSVMARVLRSDKSTRNE